MKVFEYTPAQASAILGAITPAALTMVVLILSMLLLAVQLASSQFSPRLIGGLLSRRPVKVCMFIFVFTYVYSAGVLGRIGEQIPQLSVLIAIVCTLVSVAAGLFLIDHLGKELRPVRMLARTADHGARCDRACLSGVHAGRSDLRGKTIDQRVDVLVRAGGDNRGRWGIPGFFWRSICAACAIWPAVAVA